MQMEYIGAYLRFKREQQHKDAGALCLSCNLTRMQLHSIEQGKSEAHPNTIKRICDYLNIDFIALFQHQEKYRELLEESFIALIYMRKDEQQMLMQKIEALHFEHSILYPQYLLIHLMYVAIHEGAVEKYQSLLKQCSYFIDVLEPRHQFIYYLYKGYYQMLSGQLEESLHTLCFADGLSVLEHREILYSMYGRLYYYRREIVLAIEYYKKAYELLEKKWNINRLLATQCALAACYNRMKEYDVALQRLMDTLKLAKQYKNTAVIKRTYYELVMNRFMVRDYHSVIQLGEKAITIHHQPQYLYFLISYASVKENEMEKAYLWLKQRLKQDTNALLQQLLTYVYHMAQGTSVLPYLVELIQQLEKNQMDTCELYRFLLEDLANLYHDAGCYQKESYCLRKLMQMGY